MPVTVALGAGVVVVVEVVIVRERGGGKLNCNER